MRTTMSASINGRTRQVLGNAGADRTQAIYYWWPYGYRALLEHEQYRSREKVWRRMEHQIRQNRGPTAHPFVNVKKIGNRYPLFASLAHTLRSFFRGALAKILWVHRCLYSCITNCATPTYIRWTIIKVSFSNYGPKTRADQAAPTYTYNAK